MSVAPSRKKPTSTPARAGADKLAAGLSHARLLGAFVALSSLDDGAEPRWEPAFDGPRERIAENGGAHAFRSDVLGAICDACPTGDMTLRLRELGVNARGTREVLAARLLAADPAFVESRLVSGRAFARSFDAPRASPKHDALECLRRRDIDAAIEAALLRRIETDRGDGLPMTWREPDFRRDMRLLLRQIFTSWPGALDDIPAPARGAYRIAASMMALLDRPCSSDWIDAKGPTRLRLTGQQIARTLVHVAHHEQRRKRWRGAGITHARVVFASTPCPACSAVGKRVYNLRGLPELPPSACACEGGYSGHLVAYRRERARAAGWSPVSGT